MNQIYYFCPVCGAKNFQFQEPNYYYCQSCHYELWHNSAPTVGALFLKNQQVLLTKRANPPMQNYWDTPGGFINPFESDIEALKREMKEELNLDIEISDYLGTYPDFYADQAHPTLNLYYLVLKWKGEMKIQDDINDYKWFDLDKIPFDEISFENSKQVLRFVQKNIVSKRSNEKL